MKYNSTDIYKEWILIEMFESTLFLNKAKRFRGLDTLLGHLLDKDISVWYKLTDVVAVQIYLKIKVKSRYKVIKIRKCTEWPQTELERVTVKSTPYTINTYPRGPNFGPFRSTTSCFQDTRASKIGGNAPNDSKPNLNTYQSKVSRIHLCTLHIYPWGPSVGWFILLYD